MADSDSDEDLKRAIALSLEESKPQSKPMKLAPAVISLVSDDEDEDDDLDAPLKVIISWTATTKNEAVQPPQGDSKSSIQTLEGESPGKSSFVTQLSTPVRSVDLESAPRSLLSGLDRKKMEEERLARAAERKRNLEIKSTALETNKRKASTSPPHKNTTKKQALDQLSEFPLSLSGQQLSLQGPKPIASSKLYNVTVPLSRGSTNTKYSDLSVTSTIGLQQTSAASGIKYPDGIVKKTWVHGFPRLGDDVKIEEVLQKDDLELAVLSAYQVDPDWIMSKLKPSTRVVMILQAKTEEEKRRMLLESDENFRFCFPSMKGQINCMHSKLQLLAYPTHLRIVVPSANLVPYDWGETGVMENICFLIDLPRLPAGQNMEPRELTLFGTELLYFLEASGLDQALIKSLRNFDFARTAHLAFVHTIGGSHNGSAWQRTGYCGLGTAVTKLGLQTNDALSIDFLTASIGNVTEEFMKCMVLAVKGDDGTTEFGWRSQRTDKTHPKKNVKAVSETEKKLSDEVQRNCRIFFPTKETVARSLGGVSAGGTICTQAKWYDSPTFPRSLLRDSKSVREGILMHDKLILVRPKINNGSYGRAWAYIGSANLSESAWGRLVKDRTSKKPKLNCRNWECGVLFPVSPNVRSQTPTTHSLNRGEMGMDVFQGQIPVPMLTMGQSYEGRRPWFNLGE